MKKEKQQKSGFSLVELLAAMAVLGMLAVLLAQTFTGTATVYTQSFASSDKDAVGRAALSILTRELTGAVADEFVPMRLKAAPSGGGYGGGAEIAFVSLGVTPDSDSRGAAVVYYRLEETSGGEFPGDPNLYSRYRLVRYFSDAIADVGSVYDSGPGWSPGGAGRKGVVADNVSAFDVVAYDFEGQKISSSGGGFSDLPDGSSANRGVAYLEIYLEILGKQFAPYVNSNPIDNEGNSISSERYVANNCRRYFTRVHLPNALGARIEQQFNQ